MSRRYIVHRPGEEPLTIAASRAVVEHGGSLALYLAPPGGDREALVAAFAPGGWLRMELLP